jgi:hypothetical protein
MRDEKSNKGNIGKTGFEDAYLLVAMGMGHGKVEPF